MESWQNLTGLRVPDAIISRMLVRANDDHTNSGTHSDPSSRTRIYSVQSRLRFLPFPRKILHVHINTLAFIRPTPCPRVPPIRRRHTLVHGVTSQHRPEFRHGSRGIP